MAAERMKLDSGRKDIFSYILSAKDPETGKGFSTDEIWGESTLLIIAGSDAISTALASCFFYPSRHPEAHRAASQEVRSTFLTEDEIRMANTLRPGRCQYLRACIDEAMRMSPPVGATLCREVLTGGTSIARNRVAAGCDVGIGIYAINHNAEYFPGPFAYRPERWIPSATQTKESVEVARAAFQAFSTGPVGCMGKSLAYMELTVTLARVLWHLDFEAVEEESSAPTSSPTVDATERTTSSRL